MPTQKLDYWTIEGEEDVSVHGNMVNGVQLKYNRELDIHHRVPVAAYQEVELMFDACLSLSSLTFIKTMLSPKNTKPENRRFELRCFITCEEIGVHMAEDDNAQSS